MLPSARCSPVSIKMFVDSVNVFPTFGKQSVHVFILGPFDMIKDISEPTLRVLTFHLTSSKEWVLGECLNSSPVRFTSAKRGWLVCFLPFIVAKILKLNFSGKGTDFILLRNDGIHRTVTVRRMCGGKMKVRFRRSNRCQHRNLTVAC